MQKYIFHIDIDCFFVSAQRTINKSLINKPVVISKNHSRSIALAVSYEARNLGAKVAMPIFSMKNIIKNLIIVKPQYELYSYLSNTFFEYLSEKWTSNIEIMSIDECYLDVTALVKNSNAITLAHQIQQEVFKVFQLPISIGISHNKFLAKMATNLGKPFGVFELNDQNFRNILYPLSIEKFYSIGKASVIKLKNNNIHTIGDFAQKSEDDVKMKSIFGKRFFDLWNCAQGQSGNELNIINNNLKQIGNSFTFTQLYIDERKEIIACLKQLCQKIALRMANNNYAAQVVMVQIKCGVKKWKNKQLKLPHYIDSFEQIYKIALKLFDDLWTEQPIKGIGIACSQLTDQFKDGSQISLFENEDKNLSKVEKIIQKVNYSLKKKEVYSLADLEKNSHKETKFLKNNF